MDPWDDYRFPPHRSNDEIIFYHVYDNLSQTPYVPGEGISSALGRKRNLEDHSIDTLITRHRLFEHLDWDNRNSSPFISLCQTWGGALREARRRARQISVWNKHQKTWSERKPSSIRIARVSSRELDDLGVHYFSADQFIDYLDIGESDRIRHQLHGYEFFVSTRLNRDRWRLASSEIS